LASRLFLLRGDAFWGGEKGQLLLRKQLRLQLQLNVNVNGGTTAGVYGCLALGEHGWAVGTRRKYVRVGSCVAIHGNTRSRQPTRAHPLTGNGAQRKSWILALPLLVGCSAVSLPGYLAVWLFGLELLSF
jgi:hypothetical protein